MGMTSTDGDDVIASGSGNLARDGGGAMLAAVVSTERIFGCIYGVCVVSSFSFCRSR